MPAEGQPGARRAIGAAGLFALREFEETGAPLFFDDS
jgi:hypothetical protein